MSNAELKRMPPEERERLQQDLVAGLTKTPLHRFFAKKLLRNDPDALEALSDSNSH